MVTRNTDLEDEETEVCDDESTGRDLCKEIRTSRREPPGQLSGITGRRKSQEVKKSIESSGDLELMSVPRSGKIGRLCSGLGEHRS